MKPFLTFFLAIGFVFSLGAQHPLKLKFDSSVPADQSMVLYEYEKTLPKILKTFSRGKNDSLVLTELKKPGLYMLTVMQSMTMAEFIYNPNENITIHINYPDLLNGQLTIKGSRDNVCYTDLQKINTAYDIVLDTLHAYRMNIPVSASDFYKKCTATDSLFEAVAREKNSRLTSLQFYYTRTFTSQILVPFHLVPVANTGERSGKQTPYAFIKANYFKYVVNHPNALRHHTLYDCINRFFMLYTENTEPGVKQSVSITLQAFSLDTAVYASVSRFLVRSFIEQQTPAYAWYTLAIKNKTCALPWRAEGMDFSSNYQHVQKGNIVDDIILNDINGNPVSLNQTCKKSKQTVLLFWDASCKDNDSLLMATCTQLRKNKATVFCVYMGENKGVWKAETLRFQMKNWVNVSELKPIEKSNLVPRFMVTSTPLVYVLNKERKIIKTSE